MVKHYKVHISATIEVEIALCTAAGRSILETCGPGLAPSLHPKPRHTVYIRPKFKYKPNNAFIKGIVWNQSSVNLLEYIKRIRIQYSGLLAGIPSRKYNIHVCNKNGHTMTPGCDVCCVSKRDPTPLQSRPRLSVAQWIVNDRHKSLPSIYYHLKPDNNRLVWLASLFSSVIVNYSGRISASRLI